MAGAAVVEPMVRKSLGDLRALALFASNYVFVLTTAFAGTVASHSVWVARRQVFEARKLGRYRLNVRVGRGGMGEVWLARDDDLGRDVARKVLPCLHAVPRPSATQRPYRPLHHEARCA